MDFRAPLEACIRAGMICAKDTIAIAMGCTGRRT